MNLYIRFFDKEILATSMNEAFDFLQSIPEIDLDEYLMSDIEDFVNSDQMYPKRYKVSGRSYFIVIKTTSATLEEFKARGSMNDKASSMRAQSRSKSDMFMEINPGWYEGTLTFKRVVAIGNTQKFQYVDTRFKARVKAQSIQDCYNRIINHLRTRHDVDPRSQFPSIKGRNFECVFVAPF